MGAVREAVEPRGYTVSQKTRVLDAVRACADNPLATAQVGPSLGEMFLPVMREVAGPLVASHPWLEPGDLDYAFKSHFDFVVHAPVSEGTGCHPLLAVEFDGPGHSDSGAMRRALRKNRLCAASGLPLLRVDDTLLARRDRLVFVTWLLEVWTAYRAEMPRMLAERDSAVAELDDAELQQHGSFLLGERPDLDIDLIFRLEHPFPPTATMARRLRRRYGLIWSLLPPDPVERADPRWIATGLDPLPRLRPGLIETWTCDVNLRGPKGQSVELHGMVDTPRSYPLASGPLKDSWDEFFAGRLACLPVGPWLGASDAIGYALCLHNTLVEIHRWLYQHESHQ